MNGANGKRARPVESTVDLLLRDDIRLLGRLLGDTLRRHEGDDMFDVVEGIRQIAVRFRRDGDPSARTELTRKLDGLEIEATISVVRAFTYFSHLANIAEDQHKNRLNRRERLTHEKAREGSLELAFERLKAAKVTPAALRRVLAQAAISPVLTAHPTEVQRKSILDRQAAVARLLTERDRVQLTDEERAENERSLVREIETLWQTRMLRRIKLTVYDEIENALAYYRYTFLSELPLLYASLEERLDRTFRTSEPWQLPPFLRIGSWIGGDRDGNPFVTKDVLVYAVHEQSRVAFEHYFEEVHALGAELSLSLGMVPASTQLLALASASPDRSEHRTDEPYRRVLVGIHARLAATAERLNGQQALRHPAAIAPPYGTSTEFITDLEIRERVARGERGRRDREGAPRAAHPRRPDVQLSPGGARPAPELRRARARGRRAARGRGGRRPTICALDEAARERLLLAELATARPLVRAVRGAIRTKRASELAILRAAARAPRAYGAPRIRTTSSRRPTASGRARGGAAAQGGGARATGRRARRRDEHDPALRDHRRPPRAAAGIMHDLFSLPVRTATLLESRGDAAGGHARLLRQQQGRRLPDVELGAVQGRARARRRVRAPRRACCACSTAAAAPWGAAAAPATTPSSRSRAGSVSGQLRLTEQGEVIASKYADREHWAAQPRDARRGDARGDALARRTRPSTSSDARTSCSRATMEALSRARVRAPTATLVYETPGFIEYFRAATPIARSRELNIGSRPASRKSSERIEDLRAIPWVFSWGAVPRAAAGLVRLRLGRAWLPAERPRRGALELLRAMYARWPFFRHDRRNLEMVLAKTDMGIAARYAELVRDARAARRHLRPHPARVRRTRARRVLAITERRRLLPATRRSRAASRNRIALHRSAQPPAGRAAAAPPRRARRDERVRRAIHLTINGVAAGLRNSG